MKTKKTISISIGILVLIIGAIFNFGIAILFSQGGTMEIPLIYFIIGAICLILLLPSFGMYKKGKGIGLLQLAGLVVLTASGILIHIILDIIAISQFRIN